MTYTSFVASKEYRPAYMDIIYTDEITLKSIRKYSGEIRQHVRIVMEDDSGVIYRIETLYSSTFRYCHLLGESYSAD